MKRLIRKTTSLILSLIIISAPLSAVSAENATPRTVTFGYYPQSLLTSEKDGEIIEALGQLLTDESLQAFDYYTGDGNPGSEKCDDYTFFADVNLEGAVYRAVTFEKYRPDCTYGSPYGENDENKSYQYKNGYFKNSVYWFRYEPIRWKVLDEEAGLLMSEKVLDTRPFAQTGNSVSSFTDSDLYAFLNGDFAALAFTAEERSYIQGDITALSFAQATNEQYGYSIGINKFDNSRIASPSDYSECLGQPSFDVTNDGLQAVRAYYWINDESFAGTGNSRYCSSLGNISSADSRKNYGVRPVMTLNLESGCHGKTPVTYFYDPGHTLSHTDYYISGESVTPYSPESIEGYTFLGWHSKVPEKAGNDRLVFYAEWEKNRHNLTFDANEGKFSDSTEKHTFTILYGDEISSEQPGRRGYIFTGWDKTVPDSMPDNDLYFTAQWIPAHDSPYSVAVYRQNPEDGSYDKELTACAGTTGSAVNITPETKEHYIFNSELSKTEGIIEPDGSAEFSLYYDLETFELGFDFNDGSTVKQTLTFRYGQNITVPDIPSRNGYTTEGWLTFAGEQVPDKCTSAAEYILTWISGRFQISFDTDGGSYINNLVYEPGEPVVSPPDPSKDGFTFAGWSPGLPETMPNENLSVKALWVKNRYKITFDLADGSLAKVLYFEYGKPVSPPDSPEKEGYTFVRWSPSLPENMPANDLTVTAIWEKNRYSVIFYSDGGTYTNPFTGYFGEPVQQPGHPEKEGFTFCGWYPAVPKTIPAHDTEVTAVWERNSYTISFYTDGGSALNPVTLEFGEPAALPENPVKEGYSFTGWETDLPGKAFPEAMPSRDFTATALWKKNSYSLIYIIENKEFTSVTVAFGDETPPAPQAPEREGYSFSWEKAPGFMPACNTRVFGSYTAKYYNVIFKQGNEEYARESIAYGSPVSLPPAPSKEGMVFAGWSPDIPETMPAHNLEFNAVFEKKPKVSIRGYKPSIEVGYGTTVTFHAIAEAEKYDKLIWVINGKAYDDDGSHSFKKNFATSSYTICCRIVSGKTVRDSLTETVNVKTGLPAIIMWLYFSIFARSRLNIDQR